MRVDKRRQENLADELRKAVSAVDMLSRSRLQQFLESLARTDEVAARTCADASPGVLGRLDPKQQLDFLVLALELISWPEVAAAFFCECSTIVKDMPPDGRGSWIGEAKTIARENPLSAAAFLKRESRRGVDFLKSGQASLHLREIDRVLELYCTALAGRRLTIRSTADAPAELLRRGHRLPTTDGKTIFLPESLGADFSVEPFGAYQVLAAHQAGYIEFGTFDFDIDVFRDRMRLEAIPRVAEPPSVLVSHYEVFFTLFRNHTLARDIFFAVEDGRVDHRLCLQYPGLAARLKRVSADAAASRPLPSEPASLEAMVERLIRLSLGEEPKDLGPDYLRQLWDDVAGSYSRVLNPNATAVDSAVAAAEIYAFLGRFFEIEVPRTREAGEQRQFGEAPFADDASRYAPAEPVDFRGQTDPARVQLSTALNILKDLQENSEADHLPLTPEALEKLARLGVKIKIVGMDAKELAETAGLFVTDLKGLLQEKTKELSPEERKKLAGLLRCGAAPDQGGRTRVYFYDEWDYLIGDYRPRWCRLQESPVAPGAADIVARIKKEHAALIASVRRHYQRIRPEMLRKVKRLRDGEELEMDHVIDSVIDRRIGLPPNERVYQNRERKARDIATCFLLDISASTDEWVTEDPQARPGAKSSPPGPQPFSFFTGVLQSERREESASPEQAKRVIDIEREALVIMAEALEGLGDEYAIYGFSGYGHDNVEFFPVKEFSESYSQSVRRRIGAIEPHKSTRMGPAIRHALEKLSATGRKMKVLILLSDGYPQDFDYGPDRSSREYGLHDTMMALQEARRRNVQTFCITVDQAGNDYLHDMCGGRDYFVVKKPGALPKILPRIYRKLTF